MNVAEMPEKLNFDIYVQTASKSLLLDRVEYIRADIVRDMIKEAIRDNEITVHLVKDGEIPDGGA